MAMHYIRVFNFTVVGWLIIERYAQPQQLVTFPMPMYSISPSFLSPSIIYQVYIFIQAAVLLIVAQIRGHTRHVQGNGEKGRGRGEATVNSSRNEMADRIARYQAEDY